MRRLTPHRAEHGRTILRASALLLLGGLAGGLLAPAAASAQTSGTSSTTTASPTGTSSATGTSATGKSAVGTSATAPSFGAMLGWSSPSDAETYARALHATPGFYGETLGYPLTGSDVSELESVTRASAAQGAAVLLTLDPRQPLRELGAADAARLASTLATLSGRYKTRFTVNFAPDMNGSWTPWGQQPDSYVAAYRTLASAVHADVADAKMIWEPSNGAGYPFGRARGVVTPSGPRVSAQLDTNHDGKVDERDDPYGVYWPGRSSVDEVGFADFWYGTQGALGHNSRPTKNFFVRSLQGTVGYSTRRGSGRNFVARFSTAQKLPLLVETGALYVPFLGSGATRSTIADTWIRQVFAPSVRARFPTLASVMWFERNRTEAESDGAVVDWRVTQDTGTAALLRSSLRTAGYPLGPVPVSSGQAQANAAVAQADQLPGEEGGGSDRILGSICALLGLFLIAGLAARLRPSWRYPAPDGNPARASVIRRIGARGELIKDTSEAGRDGRIDLLRGFVMAAVVITHMQFAGPWTWFVQRAGALTGAEMFVLLSGIVLSGLYSRIVARAGTYAAAVSMVRRAGRLYLGTVAVILAVFFLSKIPGVDATSVTTFTDRGTGTGGAAAAGRVYFLYGTSQHLLDYPPPFYALRDLLLLRYGPWPINIMGLFVILSLLVPAAMWLVKRRLWWVLLAVSWGLYAINIVHPVRIFDAEFESVFPLFAWQVAFTHGLVIGHYRSRILRALSSRAGKIAITVVLAGYVAGLLVLRAGVRIGSVPTWANLYNSWYQRTDLDGGRLVDLALSLVVCFALLTTCWRPLHATIGRVFEPLGRVSLQVFFLQVFLILAAGNIPHLSIHSAWQGFLVQTGALTIAWLAVRWRPGGTPPPAAAPAADSEAKELTLTGS